jgi:S-layer protein (TIGR01564 family)
VTQPYALTSNLVGLDTDGAGTGAVIVVGGPMVNTMAAEMVQGANIDFSPGQVVVKEIVPGSKILVAGGTAADTMSAAETFIADIKRQ